MGVGLMRSGGGGNALSKWLLLFAAGATDEAAKTIKWSNTFYNYYNTVRIMCEHVDSSHCVLTQSYYDKYYCSYYLSVRILLWMLCFTWAIVSAYCSYANVNKRLQYW